MLNDSVPLVTQRIPSVVRETLHYEWIGRKSGTDADLPVPYNYLEIPDQMLPNTFLQLAEEARELMVIEESSGLLDNVQSGASQWSGPPLMGVLTGGHHGPFGRESVDHVVTPGWLVGKRRIASADSGGLLDNWRTREDICDESGLVPEFRPVRNDRNTATVVSGSRKGRQVWRDRSGPVGKQIMSEPSVRFVHKSAYMSDTAVKPEGQDGCFKGPTRVSRQYDSPSEGQGIDRPVNAEGSVYTSAGPLGFRVTLGGQITDWPDPVEPPGTVQQVLFPRPIADREGCISADSVHPAVTMFSAQPVAAGYRTRLLCAVRWTSTTQLDLRSVARWAGFPIPNFDRLMSSQSCIVTDGMMLWPAGQGRLSIRMTVPEISIVLIRLTMSRISLLGNGIPWLRRTMVVSWFELTEV